MTGHECTSNGELVGVCDQEAAEVALVREMAAMVTRLRRENRRLREEVVQLRTEGAAVPS